MPPKKRNSSEPEGAGPLMGRFGTSLKCGMIGPFELTMVQYYLYAYDFIFSFKNFLSFYYSSSSCVWFQTVTSCICVVLRPPSV